MKIFLLSVGKPRDRVIGELHDRYVDRLTRLGVRYDSGWVPDVEPGGRYSEEHARQREARSLLDRLEGLPRTSIALDPGGRALRSEELAVRLERWTRPGCTLIIGGPLGLHASVVERCDHVWSLSSLTFPHELVRAIVAEQLYRALTISRGLPYHK